MKVITTNKKAHFNYFLESTFEAGIVLVGSEVKSIRLGHVSLVDAFVSVNPNGELYIKNMYIKPYEKATSFAPTNDRQPRKLLLNKSEIKKLGQKTREKSYTIVPTKIYLKGQFVKLEIALAKGKHTYDKKQVIKDKDIERDTKRTIKTYTQAQ